MPALGQVADSIAIGVQQARKNNVLLIDDSGVHDEVLSLLERHVDFSRGLRGSGFVEFNPNPEVMSDVTTQLMGFLERSKRQSRIPVVDVGRLTSPDASGQAQMSVRALNEAITRHAARDMPMLAIADSETASTMLAESPALRRRVQVIRTDGVETQIPSRPRDLL